MAGEIQADYLTGYSLYAHLVNGVGQVWNGSAFVAPDQADWEDYAIALTEVMPTHYQGDMPVVAAGRYGVRVYRQGGASPSAGDGPAVGVGEIDWDGSAEVGLADLNDLSAADVLQQVTAALDTKDVATEGELLAVREMVKRILGLTQDNWVLRDTTHDDEGNLLTATIRVYDSAVNAAADTGTGLLYSYTLTNTYTDGLLTTSTQARVS